MTTLYKPCPFKKGTKIKLNLRFSANSDGQPSQAFLNLFSTHRTAIPSEILENVSSSLILHRKYLFICISFELPAEKHNITISSIVL